MFTSLYNLSPFVFLYEQQIFPSIKKHMSEWIGETNSHFFFSRKAQKFLSPRWCGKGLTRAGDWGSSGGHGSCKDVVAAALTHITHIKSRKRGQVNSCGAGDGCR